MASVQAINILDELAASPLSLSLMTSWAAKPSLSGRSIVDVMEFSPNLAAGGRTWPPPIQQMLSDD